MSFGRELGGKWVLHVYKKHTKGKEPWTKCYICLTGYSFYVSLPILIGWAAIRTAKTAKKEKINYMNETLIYLLVLLGILLVPLISILLNYYFERKKRAAETEKLKSEVEKLKLQNKITKEITYDQLKTESKQKDIKGKIEIFSRINKLETEIKNKKNDCQRPKKIEALEAIKKEFKKTLAEEEPQLVEPEKSLEAKKKGNNSDNETKKAANGSKKKKKQERL